MAELTPREVDRVMQALPPQARIALNAMSELQHRSPEDVLRDEIRNYIAGRIPAVDLEGAVASIRSSAYEAGRLIGTLSGWAKRFGED